MKPNNVAVVCLLVMGVNFLARPSWEAVVALIVVVAAWCVIFALDVSESHELVSEHLKANERTLAKYMESYHDTVAELQAEVKTLRSANGLKSMRPNA